MTNSCAIEHVMRHKNVRQRHNEGSAMLQRTVYNSICCDSRDVGSVEMFKETEDRLNTRDERERERERERDKTHR